MTPAVLQARRAGIDFSLHEYPAGDGNGPWGLEAARRLGLEPEQVLKTLVLRLSDQRLVLALLPVHRPLDLKLLARAAGARKAALADAEDARRATGYVPGGISPLGPKQRLPCFIERSAASLDQVFVSGGRRGLEIGLSPEDLRRLTAAQWADLLRL